MRPSPGSTFGDYEVVEELGKGGMGRVFRAHHVVLDRDVALKVLDDAVASDETFRLRFVKEARSAARLNHRNIVQIYDFGQVEGAYYIAMEFVSGRTLGTLLHNKGPFSELEAVALTRAVCTALRVAHEAGVVHRDVKPDNLILRDDGVVKLVDLGLAKSVSDDQNATQTGVVAGTPHYISPEQIEGRRDVDGRADIYSLGATLFHLVTGQRPFEGSSPMVVIAKHLHEEPRDPRQFRPDLSDGLCAVMRRMMARDRDQRYPDVAAVDAELEKLEQVLAATATAPTQNMTAATTLVGPSPPRRARGAEYDPSLLAALEFRLSAAIGPLARVLVRNAANRAADPEALCTELAKHIPFDAERQTFIAAVHADPAWPHERSSSREKAAEPDRVAGPSASDATAGPSRSASWNPDTLRAVERLLAAAIGPMARVVVKRAARTAATWDELIAVLAESLPAGADAEAFCANAATLAH
jgi:eukaryotic-like serine/threonine-protein kinase